MARQKARIFKTSASKVKMSPSKVKTSPSKLKMSPSKPENNVPVAVHGNVLIFPYNQLKGISLGAVNNVLHMHCGHFTSPPPTDESYVAAYVSHVYEPPNSLLSLEIHPTLGVAFMEKNGSELEISNFCVNNRSGDVANKLLGAIILKNPNFDKVWLSIDMSVSNYVELVDDAIEWGFGDPKVTNRTPSDITMGKHHLTLVHPSTSSSEVAKKYAVSLKQTIDDQCTYNIKLNTKSLDKIFDFVKNGLVEYGGVFKIDDPKEGDSVRDIRVSFNPNPNSLYKGDSEGYFVQVISNEPFIWHTHPNICYDKFKCSQGWPSAADMVATLQWSLFWVVHIVATREGIYIIRVSHEFRHFYGKMSDTIKSIVNNLVRLTFQIYELERKHEDSIYISHFLTSAVFGLDFTTKWHDDFVKRVGTINYAVSQDDINLLNREVTKDARSTMIFNLTFVSMADMLSNQELDLEFSLVKRGPSCPSRDTFRTPLS